MDKLSVTAIVVSWNAKEHLVRCLEHLARQAPHELVVVDNGSTDGSREMLSDHRDMNLVNLENPGFGAANNVGARLSRGRYLLLVNSDCELQDDALRILAQVLAVNPRVGIVGPLLRQPNGRIQRSAGRAPNLVTEALNKTMLHRVIRYYTYGSWNHTDDRGVDWVCGACMMIRREVFENVGGFDERFFMFMEDVDLCKRVRDAGYEVRFTAQAAAVHHGGGSQAAVKTAMLLESERSVRMYFGKHHPRCTVRTVRLLSMIEAVIRSCFWIPALVVPHLRGEALARLRAYPHFIKKTL
ncbi:MAG: glycosyltransferase family 2 protein [Solirubrobacteraceae bacterium]